MPKKKFKSWRVNKFRVMKKHEECTVLPIRSNNYANYKALSLQGNPSHANYSYSLIVYDYDITSL